MSPKSHSLARTLPAGIHDIGYLPELAGEAKGHGAVAPYLVTRQTPATASSCAVPRMVMPQPQARRPPGT